MLETTQDATVEALTTERDEARAELVDLLAFCQELADALAVRQYAGQSEADLRDRMLEAAGLKGEVAQAIEDKLQRIERRQDGHVAEMAELLARKQAEVDALRRPRSLKTRILNVFFPTY